eukprot:5046234-Pyramimonas_sp.AAC.1
MLKTGHQGLVQVLAEFFSRLLGGRQRPPSEWKLAKMRVIFKKGDPALYQNYRPIASCRSRPNSLAQFCATGGLRT